MTNPVWPSTLTPRALEWRLNKPGVQWRSPFTGSLQSVGFIGEHWEIRIGLRGEGRLLQRSAEMEPLLMYLAGGFNRIDIYHWVRPLPRGTLRGTPTLGVSTIKGDMQMVLTVAAGSTLQAGDLFGVGSQVFMCRMPCVAVGTTLTVALVNRVRTAIPSTTAVVWERPLVTVVSPELSAGLIYQPGMALPAELVLVEP